MRYQLLLFITDVKMNFYMTDKALKRIGSKLQAARKLKNLTQEQVADRVGITRSYYAQVERGERNPTTTVITAIIAAIGVEITDILM
jgi:transcriptional regulator with XRE-family HTH domain